MEMSNCTTTSKGQASARSMTLYELLESGGLDSLDSMEGAWGHWEDSNSELTSKKSIVARGVVGALAVMVVAWGVHWLPFPPFTFEGGAMEHPIGVSVMAILLGMIVANVLPMFDLKAGCRWITTWCIPSAIVFLGARMDLVLLADVGWPLFLTLVVLIVFTVFLSIGVGRMLGLNSKASYLLGVGTAICGSSAILAVAPVTGSSDEDVVLTVGVVNLVGLLAMFTCVACLWLSPMDAEFFGAWAGSTIHAVPQVVAAGESHGADAAAMATLVKLTRVTMLAPVVLLSALWIARSSSSEGVNQASQQRKLWQYIPWFVWGFIALAALRAFDLLPVLEFYPNDEAPVKLPLSEVLPSMAKWLLALSMAAIGLQVQLRSMLKAGAKAFLAGIIVWAGMSVLAYFCLSSVMS